MVGRLETLARQVIDEAIDAVLPKGGCDFVDALAVPVPMRVIAELVGVAGHDLERFRRWSDDMMLGVDGMGDDRIGGRQAEAMGSFMALFREEIAARRRAPRDDILTGLVQAADEILRWTTIVRAMRRVAMMDSDLGGKRIRAGESVVMVYASANRDAAVFDDPFAFRIDRSPNEHLSLGVGPHYCLGANLARMELQVVLERVATRLPGLRLEPGTQVIAGEHSIVRAVEKMAVVF